MSYANMNNVPTQTDGVSGVLAADWNTYVRDNFDAIKYGHVVVANDAAKTALGSVAEGTMVYQLDNNKIFVYSGSAWVEVVRLDAVGGIRRLAYTSATAGTNITQTSIGSAPDMFASGATWTADGTSAYKLEVFIPEIYTGTTAGSALNFWLVDGAGSTICALATFGTANGTSNVRGNLNVTFYYTPSAGSATVNVRATRATSSGFWQAGDGTGGSLPPAFIQISGPIIT